MELKRETPVTRLLAALLLSLSLVTGFAQAGPTDPQDAASPAATVTSTAVLVELFTSEGCSTCPPADKILANLDRTQPVNGVQVIALSEHVDYWNRLGWKDPFSSAEFSRRQTDYARVLGAKDIYTPQMIVDGRVEFVGSKLGTALEAISKAAGLPKANVSIAIKVSTPNSVTLGIQVQNIPSVSGGDIADVMLAITESGLVSDVSRGENSGRKLEHSAVTRKMIRVGAVEGRAFSAERTIDLNSSWKRQNMRAVAFTQERASRRVLGAAVIKF
jgi:hypothetical protein